MRVLVTGSNGLLGYKLTELLLEEKVEFIATSRGKNRNNISAAHKFHSMDIESPAEIEKVLALTKPDVIINTAAMTQVDDCETDRDRCWELNVKAVENLVHGAHQSGSKLIHISTDFIFDGTKKFLTEDETPSPVNFYGESKLASEKVVMESSLDWAIARTVLVYGVTPTLSRSNIILWVRQKLSAGEKIRVVNDQFRTPTLAEDLAMGCYLIAVKNAGGIFNISGKDLLTPYQMALEVADYFNLDKSLIEETDSNEFKQPAARPLKTGFNINKANVELEYNPVSFEEGIKTVEQQISKFK